MTSDVKLLPLPEKTALHRPSNYSAAYLYGHSDEAMLAYARACVEADRHAMQAEVGEARSERDRMFLSAREWAERFGQMEARAERLAEALRDALEYLQHHLPDEMLAPHRAALQETGNADVRILAEPGEVDRG